MVPSSNAVADSMYAVGFAMAEQERWRDASDVFRAMLLLCPSDERSWLGLGRCHDMIGQATLALELYSLCSLVVPGSVRARVAAAAVLRSMDRDDEAEHALESAEHLADSLNAPELVALVERARSAR